MIPYSQEDLPLSSAPIRCVWKFYVAILKSPLSQAFGTLGDYRITRIQEYLQSHGTSYTLKRLGQKAAQQVQNAKVETVKDTNGLDAVKVSFDSAILFATGKADLSSSAKNSLVQFAKVLNENKDCDIAVIGHTDITGTDAVNQPLSVNRANSVSTYLKSCGVSASQIKRIEGQGSTNPVADNSTEAGRKLNRRVEVYMYASEKMINDAKTQAN